MIPNVPVTHALIEELCSHNHCYTNLHYTEISLERYVRDSICYKNIEVVMHVDLIQVFLEFLLLKYNTAIDLKHKTLNYGGNAGLRDLVHKREDLLL